MYECNLLCPCMARKTTVIIPKVLIHLVPAYELPCICYLVGDYFFMYSL
uniref:Uncharacterized protein n=1 Tax=Ciona intestinalis TaxID=7719 RepID=H2Y3S5_CIOIN